MCLTTFPVISYGAPLDPATARVKDYLGIGWNIKFYTAYRATDNVDWDIYIIQQGPFYKKCEEKRDAEAGHCKDVN